MRLFAIAQDADLRAATKRLGSKPIVEAVGIIDDLPIDGHNEIACFKPGSRGRAPGRHCRDKSTTRALEPKALYNFRRDRLELGAKPWPLNGRSAAFR